MADRTATGALGCAALCCVCLCLGFSLPMLANSHASMEDGQTSQYGVGTTSGYNVGMTTGLWGSFYWSQDGGNAGGSPCYPGTTNCDKYTTWGAQGGTPLGKTQGLYVSAT